MRSPNNPECKGIYEGLYAGTIPGRIAYKNETHGLMVIQDPAPIERGHLVAASLACAYSVDDLPQRPHDKLQCVAKFAGLVLRVVYPNAEYPASATAGKMIRHPHIHRVPGYDDPVWARRLGKAEPRLQLSAGEMDDILGTVTTGQQVQELWARCDEELDGYGPADPLTLEMMHLMAAPVGES